MYAYNDVLVKLNSVAMAKGSKAKAQLLQTFLKEDKDFMRLVALMLDPFITFGVNSFQWHKEAEIVMDRATDEDVYSVLQRLQTRVLTGTAAREALTRLTARGVPADLLFRILNKDPKAGFQAGPVNKIIPGLIPEFSYMRCSRPDQVVKTPFDYSKGIIVQLKSDGMYINLDREESFIGMRTRQGNPVPINKFPRVLDAAKALKVGTQTHGELVIYKAGILLPRQIGNGLINSIIEGENLPAHHEVYLHVWDQIPLSCAVKKGKYKVPYKARLGELGMQLPSDEGLIQVIEYRTCYSKAESKAYFKEVLLRGLEGTVEKDPDMEWGDGTSKGQVKHKGEFECDLEIEGFTEGKGRLADTFGAIMGKSKDGLLRVNVSGMSDDLRKHINDNREAYMGTVFNVKYNGITEPSPSNNLHSLFLPRLEELRKGYTSGHTLEEIKINYQNVIDAM